MRRFTYSLLLMCSILLAGCASGQSGTGLNFVSIEEEKGLGAKYSSQIEQESKIMTDPVVVRYITNLGNKLIYQGLSNPEFKYKFKVVDTSEVNAFAIPGGYLYVNLGLLKQAVNEAEVVGVIGHEIGHVVHRHGAKKMTDAMIVQAAAMGTAVALGEKRGGQYAGMGVLLFGQAGLLHYGREAELEADKTGVDILFRTGYDPKGLTSFFSKLEKLENEKGVKGGGLSDLLRTHPPTKDRIRIANEYIANLPAQYNGKVNSPEFLELRNHIANIEPSKPRGAK